MNNTKIVKPKKSAHNQNQNHNNEKKRFSKTLFKRHFKYFNLKIIFLQLKEKQELYFYNIWAQIQTPRRLPPFPDGQSFGQVLRTITFVLWLHAWCHFHTTKRSVTFYSDFSILLNRQLQHPK